LKFGSWYAKVVSIITNIIKDIFLYEKRNLNNEYQNFKNFKKIQNGIKNSLFLVQTIILIKFYNTN